MNIIDAMKSGKRFKRKGYEYYYECLDDTPFHFSGTRDLWLSDDWEIEEEKQEITSSDIDKISAKLIGSLFLKPEGLAAFIKKELGFK